ncbi:unnamed protein product [Parajaminaea phylloscopi]
MSRPRPKSPGPPSRKVSDLIRHFESTASAQVSSAAPLSSPCERFAGSTTLPDPEHEKRIQLTSPCAADRLSAPVSVDSPSNHGNTQPGSSATVTEHPAAQCSPWQRNSPRSVSQPDEPSLQTDAAGPPASRAESVVIGRLGSMDWHPIETKLENVRIRDAGRSPGVLRPSSPNLVQPSLRYPQPIVHQGLRNGSLLAANKPRLAPHRTAVKSDLIDEPSSPTQHHLLDLESEMHHRSGPSTLRSEHNEAEAVPQSSHGYRVGGERQQATGREHADGLPTAVSPLPSLRCTSRESAPSSERSSTLCSRLSPSEVTYQDPVPATEVFGRRSSPLFLPELDHYLSNNKIFAPPAFVTTSHACSGTERAMLGLDESPKRSEKYDLAGRQLKVAAPSASRGKPQQRSSRNLFFRGRRRGFRQLEDAQDDEDAAAETGVGEKPQSPRTSFQMTAMGHPETRPDDSSNRPSRDPTPSAVLSRQQMFPPLMLLRTSSLKELKSNAVGPRAPITGWMANLPAFDTVVGFLIDTIIGLEGSSFASNLLRFEMLRDFAQIMRLNMTFHDATASSSMSKARKFFVITLPSLLALDFVSVFGLAVIFFLVWVLVMGLGLFYFWRMTSAYDANRDIQGFEGQPYIFRSPKRGTKAANIAITFMLSTLYIPLSKLALEALTWSSDFWAIDSQYASGQSQDLQTGVDPAVSRDPTDFCYTTTMRRDQFNWAWIILPTATVVLVFYTILWPLYLARVIAQMRPSVNTYNELGLKRGSEDLDADYQRQLGEDKSPLRFLYSPFRKRFAAYQSIYLVTFKFLAVLIVCFVSRDNCLFRHRDGQRMLVAQQSLLLALQVGLVSLHLATEPFVSPVSNRMELCSRVAYVLTAAVGLLVALRVDGASDWNTYVLWTMQGVSYGSSAYFSIVTTSTVAHAIKRAQNRLDFSIDIFSPRLRLERHVQRRVWQETLSILLLASPGCRMPVDAMVAFSGNRSWPPYLLGFCGTPAERHVENLKLLMWLGKDEYRRQVDLLRSEEGEAMRRVVHEIQRKYSGPDAYFRPVSPPYPAGVTSFFGKAFVVPFPPTLVIRYDQQQAQSLELTNLEDLVLFVKQNRSREVRERRYIRLCLRALDGCSVRCPFTAESYSHPSRGFGRLRNGMSGQRRFVTPITYSEGVLEVKVKDFVAWEDYNFASGFEVFVHYSNGQRVDARGSSCVRHKVSVSAARAFALPDDFRPCETVATFLHANEKTWSSRLPDIVDRLRKYRQSFHREAHNKRDVMDYSFLTDIFEDGQHLSQGELIKVFHDSSSVKALQNLPNHFPGTISLLYQRLSHLRRSDVHAYWWLWWDDLYRQNADDYPRLKTHHVGQALCVDPRQPNSIAYRPIPRHQLEEFLRDRGLWCQDGTKGPFTRGLLNRFYFTLNAFASKDLRYRRDWHTIMVGKGSTASTIYPERPSKLDGNFVGQCPRADTNKYDQEKVVCAPPDAQTSLITGGGTSENRSTIRERRAWIWQQRMDGQPAVKNWPQMLWDLCMEKLALRPFQIDTGLEPLWIYVQKDESGTMWQLAEDAPMSHTHRIGEDPGSGASSVASF